MRRGTESVQGDFIWAAAEAETKNSYDAVKGSSIRPDAYSAAGLPVRQFLAVVDRIRYTFRFGFPLSGYGPLTGTKRPSIAR